MFLDLDNQSKVNITRHELAAVGRSRWSPDRVQGSEAMLVLFS